MGKFLDKIMGKLSMIDVDPFDSRFLPVECHALLRLIAKHDQYLAQSRFLEAQAMDRAIGIVYHCFVSDYQDTDLDLSKMGDI
jgi:hypothetical protein